ncbi:MAG: STAS domain-containing protein [Armatimonadetes bacterium]|nr:STAS domain-containing protein [Armatimonadota bacterium]
MASGDGHSLRVNISVVDGLVVLSLFGEVDIASVPILQEHFQRQFAEGSQRMIVDLEGLDYLDSTGLGCVTAARRQAREAGGDLLLVCTRQRVLRLFNITGLDQVFVICRSVAEATARLQGNEP